ncbi:MAG: nuclear transport factor 2 family protein [Candidatus Sulfotelmatobacter sp.]
MFIGSVGTFDRQLQAEKHNERMRHTRVRALGGVQQGDGYEKNTLVSNKCAGAITGVRRFSYQSFVLTMALALSLILTAAIRGACASPDDDRKTVAALDTEYQAAVKKNDTTTMARILADDFVLVTGSGKTYTKADMLEEARRGDIYQQNDEQVQTVRVWGATAVVTAKLWEKFISNGKSFDHKFWFSDTYVHTPEGWKYVFGQSSTLPCQNP